MAVYPQLPRLYDNHIGAKSNRTTIFHFGDTEELFLHNCSIMPNDWKYRNSVSQLTYKFDEHGFRNNQVLEEIAKKPYIATVGCSHTMGVGIFDEETYSYHLQSLLDVPVYNMGLAAASNDVSALNVTWLLNNYNPPHTIVFQKTSEHRFPAIFTEDPSDGQLLFIGPWITDYSEYYQDLGQMLVTSDKHGYTALKDTMSEMLIRQQCKRLGVNLVVLEIQEELKSYEKELDFARDLKHFGNDVNYYLANSLSIKISNIQ